MGVATFWDLIAGGRGTESRSVDLSEGGVWLHELYEGLRLPTATGLHIDGERALKYIAVFACNTLLADMVASLPFPMYRRLNPRGKERAPDHPLYPVIHDQPNPEITAFQLWHTLQMHAGLWGNAYAHIEFAKDGPLAGRAAELWPIPPKRMKVERDPRTKRLLYKVQLPDGEEQVLFPEQVLHIPWVSLNGITGLSPIGLAREAVGLGLAAEEYGARFFGNDARPGGYLEHPGTLSKDAHERLLASHNEEHKGLSQAHKIGLLEEGMKFNEVGIPPEDAQFLETRRFQVEEIARFYRIPPHMIGDTERSTSWGTGIEQQTTGMVVFTLRPWLIRYEQAVRSKLIPAAERSIFFAEFLLDGLLRGDTPTRFSVYAIAKQWGIYSTNDILELENRNPVDGGDDYWMPMNMIPMGSPNPPPAARSIETRSHRSAANRRRIAAAYTRLFEEAAARLVRRERNDILAAAEKMLSRRTQAEFEHFVDDFYQGYPDIIRQQAGPTFLSYGEAIQSVAADEVGADPGMTPRMEAFIAAYVTAFAARWCGSSRGQIVSVVGEAIHSGEDPVAALSTRLGEWTETRPGKMAAWETVQAGAAVAKQTYQEAGVERLVWVSGANCCPYCEEMDGKTVEITKSFLNAGDSVDAGGESMPVTIELGHPPLHDGCLPGDSRVLAESVTATSKRWYDGNLLIIHTAAGHQFSCTPNHPIFTPAGWLAAGSLDVGGYVFGRGVGDWERLVHQNGQHMPARVEEIVEAFLRNPKVVAVPVPVTAEDFHGDGVGSQVAIIGTNGALRDRDYSPVGEQVLKDALVGRSVRSPFLSGLGREAHLTEGLLATSGGDMGSGRLRLPLGSRQTRVADIHGGAAIARRDSGLLQTFADRAPIHLQAMGESKLGLARDVTPYQIVAIESIPFHGDVYNLQTTCGFYLAEGIIAHNCQCDVAPG